MTSADREKLKAWYIDYCVSEFGDSENEASDTFELSFDTDTPLSIMYTSFTGKDGREHDLQVSCDLVRGVDIVTVDHLDTIREPTNPMTYIDADFDAIYYYAIRLAESHGFPAEECEL